MAWLVKRFPSIFSEFRQTTLSSLDAVLRAIKLSQENIRRSIGKELASTSSRVRADVWSGFKTLHDAIISVPEKTMNLLRPNLEKISKTLSETFERGIKELEAKIAEEVPKIETAIKETVEPLKEEIGGLRKEMKTEFESLPKEIGEMFDGAVSPIAEAIRDLGKQLGLEFSVEDIMERVTEPFNKYIQQINDFIESLMGKPPTTPEDALSRAWTFIGFGNWVAAALSAVAIGVETYSKGAIDYTLATLWSIPAIRAVVQGAERFLDTIWYAGIGELLGQKVLELARPSVPTHDQLVPMVLRGKISEERWREFLRRRGYPEDVIEGFALDFDRIPPLSDLITMVVRDVFTPGQLQPAPPIFRKFMRMLGFKEFWADAYWTAHFKRAPLGTAIDAYRRGFFGDPLTPTAVEKLEEWLKLADYHPRDWEMIKYTLWEPMSIYVLRYAFRNNLIKHDKMVEEFRKRGYHPQDAEIAARAEEHEALSGLISDCIAEIKRDYETGWISREQFIEELRALGLRGARLSYEVYDSDLRIERNQREMWADVIFKAYEKGRISREEAQDLLTQLGMQQWRIDAKLEYIDQKKRLLA